MARWRPSSVAGSGAPGRVRPRLAASSWELVPGRQDGGQGVAMSYLSPGFDPDIFISYAHLDNRTPTEGQKGWIETFHKALEARLAQRLGDPAVCYLDTRRLQGNHYLDAEL